MVLTPVIDRLHLAQCGAIYFSKHCSQYFSPFSSIKPISNNFLLQFLFEHIKCSGHHVSLFAIIYAPLKISFFRHILGTHVEKRILSIICIFYFSSIFFERTIFVSKIIASSILWLSSSHVTPSLMKERDIKLVQKINRISLLHCLQ